MARGIDGLMAAMAAKAVAEGKRRMAEEGNTTGGETFAQAQARWARDKQMKDAVARRAAFKLIPGGKEAK
jgi:hypothetical protein